MEGRVGCCCFDCGEGRARGVKGVFAVGFCWERRRGGGVLTCGEGCVLFAFLWRLGEGAKGLVFSLGV